jgi:hypothetical protein
MGTEYGTRNYTAVWYMSMGTRVGNTSWEHEYGNTSMEHEYGTRVWNTSMEHELGTRLYGNMVYETRVYGIR